MRLKYFKLGSIVKTDEINAVLTIFFKNQDKIKDYMIMDSGGYETNIANYITEFYDQLNDENTSGYKSTNIDYTNEKIIIKEPKGYIKITCQNKLNCTYTINFNGRKYQSGGGIIIIPLQDFANEFDDDLSFLIIDNKFKVEINYQTPFIKDIKGSDHVINTTEELNNIIETSENNETINLTLSGEIIHNINRPIGIDTKNVIINGGNFVPYQNIKNRIFNVASNGRLEINNATFENFVKCNSDGGLINNNGECILKNSSFTNCITDKNGIIKSTGNLIVENCSFLTCRAKNGGAIFTDKDGV